MKSLKSILFIAALSVCSLTTTSTAQTQYDYLPGGGMPIVMNSAVEACFFFNFDGDPTGINELKIVHGLNAGCYLASATGIPIYAPTNNVNGVDLWTDCTDNEFSSWDSDTAWISIDTNRLINGSHVLPFMYNNEVGFFVLKIDPGSDTLIVRGYVFGIDPKDFACYNLESTAGIEEHTNKFTGTFTDFNLMGQLVDEYYTGLTIRVFENGSTRKIYR